LRSDKPENQSLGGSKKGAERGLPWEREERGIGRKNATTDKGKVRDWLAEGKVGKERSGEEKGGEPFDGSLGVQKGESFFYRG